MGGSYAGCWRAAPLSPRSRGPLPGRHVDGRTPREMRHSSVRCPHAHRHSCPPLPAFHLTELWRLSGSSSPRRLHPEARDARSRSSTQQLAALDLHDHRLNKLVYGKHILMAQNSLRISATSPQQSKELHTEY